MCRLITAVAFGVLPVWGAIGGVVRADNFQDRDMESDYADTASSNKYMASEHDRGGVAVDGSGQVIVEDMSLMEEDASESEEMNMGNREEKFCAAFSKLGSGGKETAYIQEQNTTKSQMFKRIPEFLEAWLRTPAAPGRPSVRYQYYFIPKCEMFKDSNTGTNQFQISIEIKKKDQDGPPPVWTRTTPVSRVTVHQREVNERPALARFETSWMGRETIRSCLDKSEKDKKRTGTLPNLFLVKGFDEFAPLLRPRTAQVTEHEDLYADLNWWKQWCADIFRLEFTAKLSGQFLGMWLYRDTKCKEYEYNRAKPIAAAKWREIYQPMRSYSSALSMYRQGQITSTSDPAWQLLDKYGIPPSPLEYLPMMPGVRMPDAVGAVVPFHEIWATKIYDDSVQDSDYVGASRPPVLATLKSKFINELERSGDWAAMQADGSVVVKGDFRQQLEMATSDSQFPILSFKMGWRLVDDTWTRGLFGHEEPPQRRLMSYELYDEDSEGLGFGIGPRDEEEVM